MPALGLIVAGMLALSADESFPQSRTAPNELPPPDTKQLRA